MYDIIIAGAGPAGLSAAAELAKNKKLKVLLIEKGKILSTDKTWAGFTSDFRQRKLMPAVSKSVKKVGFATFKTGMDMRKVGFSVLDQKKFLQLLYSRVKTNAKKQKNNNITIKENCKFLSFRHSGKNNSSIDIKTTKGKFKCRILIDASGFKTPVSKRYHLQDNIFVWQCIAYEIERKAPKNLNEVLWEMPFNKEPEVNFWIDLLAGNKCSIGLMHLTKSNKLLSKKKTKNLLEKYIKQKGIKGKRTAVRQGIIAMNDFRQMSFDNILLAGNSASHAAPDTGYGLIPALDNGKLAAQVAAKAIEMEIYDSFALAGYDLLWSSKYKLNYRFNRILQLAHYNLSPEDVSRMVESFRAKTSFLVKKTKSSLSPAEMNWFFRQMLGRFPVAGTMIKLPPSVVLKITKETALLKACMLKERASQKASQLKESLKMRINSIAKL